ncbi:MAG: O-antigen ligase family protein [Phycisphaerales bacterium]|nr:O-antigen ligase family protein [Phycisphaerales bacterium]
MPKRPPNLKHSDRLGDPRSTRSSAGAPDALVFVERFALLLLLALVPLRAVVSETHTFEVPRLFRHLDAPTGAQPATSMLITGFIVAVVILVACARLYWGGRRYSWTGAEIGATFLLLAGILSFFRAGQKHLAGLGALDFLGMVLYMLALRQLLVRPWHIRLALVTVLATGAMMITKCGYQYWFEYPETIRFYEADKAKLAQAESPAEPGSRQSGFQHDFEQRLFGKTPTGYYAHPNILGSHLILIIMAAIAVVSARLREGRFLWSLVFPMVIAATGIIAMYSTLSKGAMSACGIGIILWLAGEFFGRRLAARPMFVLVGLWCAAVIGTGLFVSVLKAKPDSLGRSMLFRSMYWDGAWGIITEEGLLGVGADNFGRHFTRHKAVECPEEVESPHSWPVKFATEWGVCGLAGVLILLMGISLRLAKNRLASNGSQGHPSEGSSGSVILWAAGLGAIVFGWWLGVLGDSPGGYLAMVLLSATIPWFLAFVSLAIESKEFPQFTDDALGLMLPALGGGLIAFLIHTGIDLALFAGGPATTFFALTAVVLAITRSPEEALPPSRTASRKLAVALGGVGTVVFFCYVLVCVRSAVGLAVNLRVARTNAEPSPWSVYTTSVGYQAYRDAVDGYSADGTAQSELIEQLIPRVRRLEHADIAIELARHFQDRDPDNAIAYAHLAVLYRQRYEFSKDIADFHRAIDARRRGIDAYPTSPGRHIELANFLENYAGITGDVDARSEAARELQAALDLDAKRVYVSKPNRLTDRQKALLRERIEGLAGRGH